MSYEPKFFDTPFVCFLLICLVGLVGLTILDAMTPVSTVKEPEPCVVVGQLDNTRDIVVCDREAFNRWNKE